MDVEIINAKIEGVSLGFENHGVLSIMLSIMLSLDYGGSGHGFGGYALTDGKHLLRWIKGIIKTLELENWEELKGQIIRVKREPGYNGKIIAIGHVLEDKWFYAVEQ